MKNNKKGFTLVELLAVIVILAVVVLIAMTAVVPQMEKARKNAFVTEANKFIQGATNYYTDCQINNSCATQDPLTATRMTAAGGCITIQDLIAKGYIDKKDYSNYHGYVSVSVTNSVAEYNIAFSNGSYFTGAWNLSNNAVIPDGGTNVMPGELPSSQLKVENIGTGEVLDDVLPGYDFCP